MHTETSIDVLPSKTRSCGSILKYHYSNCVNSKSHEERFITKEHLVAYTHLNYRVYEYTSQYNFLKVVQFFKTVIANATLLMQSPFKYFATHKTHPLLKLKHFILYASFAAILTANVALP